MKRLFRIGLLLASVMLAGLQLPLSAQGLSPVADEVLIKVRPGLASTVLDNIPGKVGGRMLRRFSRVGWQQVKLPQGMSIGEGMNRFRGMAEVMSVEPNYRYAIEALSNDPRMSQLWGMTKISAPTAWSTTTGSPSVVVAVIDSGVNYNHEDLRANIWQNTAEIPGNSRDDDGNGIVDDVYGYNAAENTGNPFDVQGHGTHVAGTIGAVGNNGLGVTGVNWTVKIMPLRFIGADKTGSLADAIACYDYAIAMRKRGVNLRLINNSWTGPSNSTALRDAIVAAGNVGILSVSAAGNSGANIDTSATYPAAYVLSSNLTVAASDQNDNPASFSNYSPTKVGLAAPGVSIVSTYYSSTAAYSTMSGTSMAAPHVTGAAALLLAKNPTATVTDIKNALLTSVDKLSAWSTRVSSGGRLNLARALQGLGGSTPTPVSTYQPDLRIRSNASSLFTGDNQYSTLGDQAVTQQVAVGQTAIFYVDVQNDGNTSDSVTVTAPLPGTGWTGRFFNPSGAEITTMVTGAGWNTGFMAPGISTVMRVEMTPTTTASGTVKDLLITARSSGNTMKLDAVKATTTVSAVSGKLTGVNLTANPISPQPVYANIILTGSALGGPAEYRFAVTRNTYYSRTITTLQNYSTNNSVIWRPTSSGSYTLTVYARALGSTASYDVYKTLSYTILTR